MLFIYLLPDMNLCTCSLSGALFREKNCGKIYRIISVVRVYNSDFGVNEIEENKIDLWPRVSHKSQFREYTKFSMIPREFMIAG